MTKEGDVPDIGGNVGIPNWINSLEEDLDKMVMIVLRDDRKFVGYLRSFDQFGNLMTEMTVERHMAFVSPTDEMRGDDRNKKSCSKKGYSIFADIPVGTIVVRGENIVLFGVVDLMVEDALNGLQGSTSHLATGLLVRRPICEVLAQLEKCRQEQFTCAENESLERLRVYKENQAAAEATAIAANMHTGIPSNSDEVVEVNDKVESNGIRIVTTTITRFLNNKDLNISPTQSRRNSLRANVWGDEV